MFASCYGSEEGGTDRGKDTASNKEYTAHRNNQKRRRAELNRLRLFCFATQAPGMTPTPAPAIAATASGKMTVGL